MDWFIAIISLINLGLLVAIYRRQQQSFNDAAVLEAVAKLNQATQTVAGVRERVGQATEAVKEIEPGGANDQPTD